MKRPALLIRKELYGIWFGFYQTALLSTDASMRKLAEQVKQTRYKSWGSVTGVTFEKWWKTHSHLFEEVSVRQIDHSKDRQTNDSLLIEVPLNQSKSVLLKKIKWIIDSEIDKRTKVSTKRKTVFSKEFQLSFGAEPKIDVLREVFRIYKNVYLKNSSLRGAKLLDEVHRFYQKRPKANKIPNSIRLKSTTKQLTLSLRNLRRWITWAKQIELNVARGQFPGKY